MHFFDYHHQAKSLFFCKKQELPSIAIKKVKLPTNPKRRDEMDNLQIISIVSGKGGVGKTMLAVAIANELSRSKRTLLFDLDFFNRGLTGLFASQKSSSSQKEINPPQFLSSRNNEAWSIGEVKQNLFMVYYDDLDKSKSDMTEMKDTRILAHELHEYVQYIATECNCEFAVLDCHGGPDNTSFAACVMATHAILVSKPDRITLHGTLNFLRTLRREAPNASLDIRLIFNKVVPAFTTTFLFRFYNDYLKTEFGGRDLLAIFPLEVYLTKAFENMPFLTTAYPRSQLALKTRLVLHEIYSEEKQALLPPQLANMSFLTILRARYYMGRWPRILNLDFALKAIAVCAIVAFGFPTLLKSILLYRGDEFILPSSLAAIIEAFQIGVALSIPWILVVLVLNWTKELDVLLTYSFRTNAFVTAVISCMTLTVLWTFPAVALGWAVNAAIVSNAEPLWVTGAIAVLAAITALLIILYAARGVRNIRFDRRYVEGGFRIAFSSLVAILAVNYAL